jgi:serine/threonine-protein kinase
MSPEQLGLQGGEVTAQSDIYSLGLLAAAAALGKPLDMAGTLTEIIEKRRTVPDLSEVDAQLRPAIARMLEPKPEDRPADIGAVMALLAEPAATPVSDRTVVVRPPSRQPAEPDDPWAAPTSPPQKSIRPAPPPRPTAGGATVVGTPPVPAEEDSPFGPPIEAPVTPIRPSSPQDDLGMAQPPPKRRPGGMIAAALVVVVLLGGGAFAYQQGLLTSLLGRQSPAPDVASQTTPSVEPALPETPVQDEALVTAEPAPAPPEVAVASTTAAPPTETPTEPTPAPQAEVTTPPPSDTPTQPPGDTAAQPPVDETPPVIVAEAPETVATPPPDNQTTPVPDASDTIGVAMDDVGWLLAYKLGECQYANVTSVAENAVSIDALSTDLAPMQALMTDFQAARGYEPDIKLGLTATPQCPAVDFLHAAEPIGATGPQLTLSRYNVGNAEPFEGFIEGVAGWQLQLLIVDAKGTVSTVPLAISTSGSAAKFDLSLTSDLAEPAPMLFVLLASKSGLDAAKFAGTKTAAALFPQLLEDVRKSPDPVAITSAFFKLGG